MLPPATNHLRSPRGHLHPSRPVRSLRVGDNPIVLGGISDVWEGAYCNKRVSIEHLKVPFNDDQVSKKVRVRTYGIQLIRVYSRMAVGAAIVH